MGASAEHTPAAKPSTPRQRRRSAGETAKAAAAAQKQAEKAVRIACEKEAMAEAMASTGIHQPEQHTETQKVDRKLGLRQKVDGLGQVRARRQFDQLDADGNETLEGVELCKLAEWAHSIDTPG